MPELPEVETIACGLRPQLQQRTIRAVAVRNPGTLDGPVSSPEAFATAVTGRRIADVGRRGKLLLIRFEPQTAHEPPARSAPLGAAAADHVTGIAFHLKMTGRLFIHGPEVQPGSHTRVVFDLDDGNRLFFDDARKFGYVRVLSAASQHDWKFWQNLGPEPLEIAVSDFVELFRGKRGRIKALLLDQKVIVGIGNIYADESLFRAGIRPDARADALSPARLRALHGHVQDVLRESIAECGSSIRDYRDAHGDAGAFQNRFRVYGRSGQPCVTCARPLATSRVAGRTTVFCEHCQK